MIQTNVTVNPGNFGHIAGGIQGLSEGLGAEAVTRLIGEAFLRYGQERAYEGVDAQARVLASMSSTGRGKLHYAYAGGSPSTVGDEQHRLFESTEVDGSGGMYSIGTQTKEDTMAAWSPALERYTEYVFSTRIDDAINEEAGYREKENGVYAMLDAAGELTYRKSFTFDFGNQFGEYADFFEIVDNAWRAVEDLPTIEVGAGQKSAITKSINRVLGTSGATGAAQSVYSNYSTNLSNGKNMMAKFMIEELTDVLGRAQ